MRLTADRRIVPKSWGAHRAFLVAAIEGRIAARIRWRRRLQDVIVILELETPPPGQASITVPSTVKCSSRNGRFRAALHLRRVPGASYFYAHHI